MNPEPTIQTLKDLKDFLNEFTDEVLSNVDSDTLVWAGLISKGSIHLKKKYIEELIAESK